MNKARRQVIRWEALTDAYEHLIRQAESKQTDADYYVQKLNEEQWYKESPAVICQEVNSEIFLKIYPMHP